MTHDRQREFLVMLECAAALPRPKLDYSQPPHSAFLSIQLYHRLLIAQASYMILSRSFAVGLLDGLLPVPVARDGGLSLTEIVGWGADLSVKNLFQAYCTYPHRELVGVMADLQMEEVFIDAEMVHRLDGKPMACEFIRLDWLGENRITQVERILRTNKIQSHRPPWKEEKENLKQSAWLEALDAWRETGDVCGEAFALPAMPFPPEMMPDEQEFWDGPMARAWDIGRPSFLNENVAVLTGEKESIPQKVRDHRRNEWKTVASREKILEESQEAIAAALHHPEPTDDALGSRLDVERAYRIAVERLGDPGRRFLEAFALGQDVTEAAIEAGFSRKTGHKLLRELKKSLSQP